VMTEEESYEYEGPVAMCGGSGSSSGQIGYPAYVEVAHSLWVSHAGLDMNLYSMVDLLNAAWDNSPYATAVAYDPDTALATMITAVDDLDTIIAEAGNTTWIDDEVDAFGDIMDLQLDGVVYPKFEAGMRDINAVTSSAFSIGRTLIADGRTREIAKFTADLQKSFNDAMFEIRLRYQSEASKLRIEIEKMRIVAKSDEIDKDLEFDSKDELWNINLYQHAGNLLAAPSGGTSVPGGASTGSRALGGALSGGAGMGMAGYMAAPALGLAGPVGAIAGGILGIGLGIGSAFL